MSILQYNGGAVVAMIGKNCVAMASDTRLGQQLTTVSSDFPKVFEINKKCCIGLDGLATDIQTVHKTVRFHHKLFEQREGRSMTPKMLTNMMAEMMYARRFGNWFTFPIIGGLDENNEARLYGIDCIGGPADGTMEGFFCGGTAAEMLMGTCETMYRPDMGPEELVATVKKCMISAVDRDCFAGWGAEVTLITPQGVTTEKIMTRMD